MRKTKSALTRFARSLRTNSSDAEQCLWYHLRDRRLSGAKFRRQLPVGPYIADFACVEARLIVELDGGQHSERVAHDEARTAFLQAQGWRLVRFWNDEVLRETEAVLAVILECLSPRQWGEAGARSAPGEGPAP